MTASTLIEIARVAARVPDPDDYFAGSNAIPGALPTKVLQFCRRAPRQLGMEEAMHHRFVLIAALRVPGCVVIDGNAIWLEEGNGVLVFPFQGHHFTRIAKSGSLSWLFTTFEYAKAHELEPLRDAAFHFNAADMERLRELTEISALRGANRSLPTTAAPIILARLINDLLRRQARRLTASQSGSTNDIPFINTVSLYIHRHLNEEIAFEDIAAEVSLSVSRLRAKFKDLMGVSLGRYISEMRMQKARALLHNTHLNVSQIAESCGYESVFSFSRAFKRITGTSPTAFARSARS